MIDGEKLRDLRTSLRADGYLLDVAEGGGRLAVRISATEDACPDCLVPKELMRSLFGESLGVRKESIDLTYPGE